MSPIGGGHRSSYGEIHARIERGSSSLSAPNQLSQPGCSQMGLQASLTLLLSLESETFKHVVDCNGVF